MLQRGERERFLAQCSNDFLLRLAVVKCPIPLWPQGVLHEFMAYGPVKAQAQIRQGRLDGVSSSH